MTEPKDRWERLRERAQRTIQEHDHLRIHLGGREYTRASRLLCQLLHETLAQDPEADVLVLISSSTLVPQFARDAAMRSISGLVMPSLSDLSEGRALAEGRVTVVTLQQAHTYRRRLPLKDYDLVFVLECLLAANPADLRQVLEGLSNAQRCGITTLGTRSSIERLCEFFPEAIEIESLPQRSALTSRDPVARTERVVSKRETPRTGERKGRWEPILP